MPVNALLDLLRRTAGGMPSGALRAVSLKRGAVLKEPGKELQAVVFPLTCVASILQVMQDGTTVEAAAVGAEGAVGLEGLVDSANVLGRGLVQVAGDACSIDLATLRRMIAEQPANMVLLQRYQLLLAGQILRSAGCSHLHTARQRIARWLLSMFDRARADELHLTHEFLATTLAIGRPTVSAIAAEFQAAGLVSYRRGHVALRNRPQLARCCCECYALDRADREKLAQMQ